MHGLPNGAAFKAKHAIIDAQEKWSLAATLRAVAALLLAAFLLLLFAYFNYIADHALASKQNLYYTKTLTTSGPRCPVPYQEPYEDMTLLANGSNSNNYSNAIISRTFKALCREEEGKAVMTVELRQGLSSLARDPHFGEWIDARLGLPLKNKEIWSSASIHNASITGFLQSIGAISPTAATRELSFKTPRDLGALSIAFAFLSASFFGFIYSLLTVSLVIPTFLLTIFGAVNFYEWITKMINPNKGLYTPDDPASLARAEAREILSASIGRTPTHKALVKRL